jgi:3-phenylpropionate/cinnamic acid dioxygenase small subunit
MTEKSLLQVDVERFIFDEAALVDQRRWRDWLELFTEDMTYWAPSWVDESELTTDPEGEVSIIYMSSRKELEHRIWRFTSGESPASYPLPRTNHLVSNVRVLSETADTVVAASNWLTQCYRNKEQFFYGGQYEHTLVRQPDGGYRIRAKKVVLLNDVVLGYVDVYHL